ncbi:unnamed protein product (macronuclear) [Paramecium tetraurelia]|uniref:Protein kinase domain-containing protein n=1 Tax=Paramecium tetraurelia TaxID=5888 RepID=A0BCB9_PARTE|nr:uncharacterized protein GSPATT00004280001 [Paramecium tetraurelia]CAK56186.1 unnamed protein product [Paramecium tetraurelia]|eukprot:XP_001423584.1 hypothetical protein (macronuclear) [Paramecium tetraurelia strain d4-2]
MTQILIQQFYQSLEPIFQAGVFTWIQILPIVTLANKVLMSQYHQSYNNNQINLAEFHGRIFENSDHQLKFKEEMKVEKFDEFVTNETQYYAWFQFDFAKHMPLNIFYNRMITKQQQVKNTKVKKIIIAILKHFSERKKISLHHGNIIPENIILQFQKKQGSKSKFKFMQLYFTNFPTEQNQEDKENIKKDEESVKKVVKNLLDYIVNKDQYEINLDGKTIEVILKEIENIQEFQLRVVDVKEEAIQNKNESGWMDKFKIWNKNANKEKKTFEQQINESSNELYNVLNEKNLKFIQECEENFNINCKEQTDKQDQLMSKIKIGTCETDNQDQQESKQNNEKDQREEKEVQWLELIKTQQSLFLNSLINIIVQNFVEKVISEYFDPNYINYIKDSNAKYLESQAKQGKKAETLNNNVDIEFIINKYHSKANVMYEVLRRIFNGIQTTFLKEWNKITDNYFKEYKFDFDLQFKDLVEQHYNEFLIIIFKYSLTSNKFVQDKLADEQKLIEEQFRDYYDEWISYKILDLINNLI